MTVIVCVSDGGGMLFNKRRQSKDAEVIRDIEKLVSDGVLFICDFSSSLFADSLVSAIAVTDPLVSAGAGDFAFIEERRLSEHKEKISRLVIYRWNRKYPADFYLDTDPEKEGMKLVDTLDFTGKSHEKITREIWERT